MLLATLSNMCTQLKINKRLIFVYTRNFFNATYVFKHNLKYNVNSYNINFENWISVIHQRCLMLFYLKLSYSLYKIWCVNFIFYHIFLSSTAILGIITTGEWPQVGGSPHWYITLLAQLIRRSINCLFFSNSNEILFIMCLRNIFS